MTGRYNIGKTELIINKKIGLVLVSNESIFWYVKGSKGREVIANIEGIDEEGNENKIQLWLKNAKLSNAGTLQFK